jgi:hypothetical protein
VLVEEILVRLDLGADGGVGEGVGGPATGPAPALDLLLDDTAEQPAVQRRPRDDTEPVLLRGRNDLHLGAALGEVVEALLADEPDGAAAPGGDLVGLGDLVPGEVAGPDVEDLALLDEDVDRLPDLLEGGGAVDVVELVDVDVVGLEPLEARVHRPPDVEGGQLVVVRPGGAVAGHVAVDLGGEDGLVAMRGALREPVADDLLGTALVLAPAVHVGGVEEVDARVEGRIHDRVGVGLIGLRAEVHGAEDESADLESGASELRVLHVSLANGVECALGKGDLEP